MGLLSNISQDVLKSTLTQAGVYAAVGYGLKQFFPAQTKGKFFIGYAVGALYLLWVNSQNTAGADQIATNPTTGEPLTQNEISPPGVIGIPPGGWDQYINP